MSSSQAMRSFSQLGGESGEPVHTHTHTHTHTQKQKNKKQKKPP